jgi:cell division protease FtsH
MNGNNNGKFPQMPPSLKEPERRPRGAALIIFLVAAALFAAFTIRPVQGDRQYRNVSYTEFYRSLNDNEIVSAIIYDDKTVQATRKLSDGKIDLVKTMIPYADPTLLPTLSEHKVPVTGALHPVGPMEVLTEILPYIFAFVFLWFLTRTMQGGPGRAMSFGKSRARRYQETGKKVTFADVAGQEGAKNELQEVVAFLKEPERFTKMGAKIPRGVLLVGPPGTGKTLMARAVAGEAGVAYFHMSGSDFVEMFVGVGASRVRDLFEQGRRNKPCIIFIDELDAVGRTRGAGYGGGHDEREQTLNQLLVEMDGFDNKDGVIVLAATNRPDVLDPALLRPGRFDRQVLVAMPDINERDAILHIHSKDVKLADSVDISRVARASSGMSGADLANLVNEAALLAARKDEETVTMTDFEEARDKILMGIPRANLAISEHEKRMTAIHESGHALLHYFLPNADPLHKVTILPRGQALGMAMSLPEEDSYSRCRGWLEDRIVICYGGWAAEKLVYGETTTGTKQDLEQATNMARKMACEWGMAESLGPITYGQEDEPIFLAKEIQRRQNYSEYMASKIDQAIKAILDGGRERASKILADNRAQLEKLADALVERETLLDTEIRALLDFPVREDLAALA